MYAKSGFAQPDSLLQKPGKNNIQLSVGLVHMRLIDEGFTQSKLLFRGTNPKIDLSYGHQNTQSIFNFWISIGPGKVRTKQGELPCSFLNVSSAIDYSWKIKLSKSQRKKNLLLVGPRLSSINYVMQSEAIFDNVDAFSLHGMYLKLAYQLNPDKKQSVEFTYSLPAVVYSNRVLWNSGASVYSESDTRRIMKLLTMHGRYSYFDILNNIQIAVAYKRQITTNVAFTARYDFKLFNNSIERPIALYSNELALGLQLNFR